MAVAVILIILVAIGLLAVGIDAAYESGPYLAVRVGPVKLKILPLDTEEKIKKAKVKKKKAKKEKQEPDDLPEEKKPLDFEYILELIGIGLNSLKRLRKSITVDFLRIHYTAASRDPYSTAMQYGGLCSAMSTFYRLIDSAVTIEDSDIKINADFDSEKPVIIARITVTIQVWKILYIGVVFGYKFLMLWLKKRKNKNERMINNGERPNRRDDGNNDEQDKGNGGRQYNNRRSYNDA